MNTHIQADKFNSSPQKEQRKTPPLMEFFRIVKYRVPVNCFSTIDFVVLNEFERKIKQIRLFCKFEYHDGKMVFFKR